MIVLVVQAAEVVVLACCLAYYLLPVVVVDCHLPVAGADLCYYYRYCGLVDYYLALTGHLA